MERLEDALDHAHLPALVAVLYHLTGDKAWLSSAFSATYRMGEPIEDAYLGGYPLALAKRIRTAAAQIIASYLASPRDLPQPNRADISALMNIVAGSDVPESYNDYLTAELQLGVDDGKRPDWRLDAKQSAGGPIDAIIVGAGMSGLLAGLRLKQAGVAFTIFERNCDVGGTWFENRYPGCRVDNSNHMYSYSFEPAHDFPDYFSRQPVLLDYFQRFVDKHELRKNIRFDTRVERAVFDEDERRWRVNVADGAGRRETLHAAVLISAVGQLNTPLVPDIEGIFEFAGAAFHSARWDHDVPLEGKNVAVIGTGASAYQFVPEIASTAGRLSVFQRSPPWGIPRPHYHRSVPDAKKWLLRNVPFYARWHRFYLFWTSTESIYPAVKCQAGWQGDSLGEINATVRDLLRSAMLSQVEGRPDLRDKILPTYPFGSKRALLDNGVWVEALKRDNVELVTASIDRIEAGAVVTSDGTKRPADVIIFGTGFEASRFLSSMRIVGRGGFSLHDFWQGDARAYLGLTVPGFPNFFMLYGPNTNVVVNGSIIFFSECGVGYILDAIHNLARRGGGAIEVRHDVYEQFNREIDAANCNMAWGIPGAQNWYKNATGRVSQNWPYPTVDYWRATRRINEDDFIFSPPDEEARRAVSPPAAQAS